MSMRGNAWERALKFASLALLKWLFPPFRRHLSSSTARASYRLQGMYDKSEDALREALRIKLKCPELGPNHPGTVTTYSNLGKL